MPGLFSSYAGWRERAKMRREQEQKKEYQRQLKWRMEQQRSMRAKGWETER